MTAAVVATSYGHSHLQRLINTSHCTQLTQITT